jgi:hypothetical protein
VVAKFGCAAGSAARFVVAGELGAGAEPEPEPEPEFGAELVGAATYWPSTTVVPPPVTVWEVPAPAIVAAVRSNPVTVPKDTVYAEPGGRFGNW